MDNEDSELTESSDIEEDTSSIMSLVLVLFLFLWLIAHIWAIIKSLLCFGASGSTAEHIFGFVLAFFIGPLYFIYLYANKGYCLDDMVSPIGGKKR
jgi:hypothetical protein